MMDQNLRTRVEEAARLLWLFANPIKTRPEAIYDLLATHNTLAESSLYLNLGYWKHETTYDRACEALALRVAEKAELGGDDEVLDVGFGFGDQHFAWLDRFQPKRITGLNVTRSQVKFAADRVAQRGLADRIRPLVGSATEMPFADAHFDKVVGVESAFHFVTREKFFAEAFRVLKPGGVLALADVIPSDTAMLQSPLRRWVGDFAGRSFWQYPKENSYPIAEYVTKLENAGFARVEREDISEHVFAPFKRFARERVNAPEVRARVNPLIRALWAVPDSSAGAARPLSYVIITARKAS